MSNTPRTTVEIVDPSGDDNVLVKPTEIHINGQPVLVEKDSLFVDYELGEVTKVTLTLLPDSVTITRK